MSRYISCAPKKRKNMGWVFLIKALRLVSIWVLFFSSVDLAAKENPDPPPLEFRDEVIVAVIDTGADLDHPLLHGKFWENPGELGKDTRGREKRTNGIDDDKNGYIDDIHGWNFVNNSNQVQDTLGHGTHITGIIAALPDPDSNFQGIAPNARIMVLKYFDPETTGFDNLKNSILAIEYATKMNAQIINYSGGGSEFSSEERTAMLQAETKGLLVVAAAGNERSDTDLKPFYPANYRMGNIISVAAVDKNSALLPSSNFGRKSVHLAAPGLKIKSTLPHNKIGAMTGTSQATAFVTGSAALLMGEGRRPIKELISLITLSVETRSSLSRMVSSQGQLSIRKSLSMKTQTQSAVGRITEPSLVPDNGVFFWKVSDTLL